ncbi:ribonuclease 1-like [Phaseolus vulgaris]
MGVQCKSRPNKFTIHGLWPQGLNGQLLTNCDASSSLSHDDIKTVEKQLYSNWPSLIGRDFDFWSSEWKKHGTCSEKEFSKLEYFETALHNHAQNDLMGILKRANIVPNKKQLYNISSVVAAVHQHTQHQPHLVCYFDALRNVSALYEIGICYEEDGKSYKNCLDPHGTCYGTELIYPK